MYSQRVMLGMRLVSKMSKHEGPVRCVLAILFMTDPAAKRVTSSITAFETTVIAQFLKKSLKQEKRCLNNVMFIVLTKEPFAGDSNRTLTLGFSLPPT
jgi:hypothetical protein